MSKRHPTIHDIAKELNITASTVSRALNDHPRISEATKELVKKTAEKLNYKPNSIASSLRKGKGNTIGVIIPIINRTFFANIIHGIESVTNEAGYHIIICQSNEKLSMEKENIKTLVNNRVSGILISISSETKDARHFEPAVKSGIPIVQFDRVIESFNSCKVLNNDFEGAYEEVTHLINKGYRRIAHFAGSSYLKMYKNRFEGYKQALADNNILFDSKLVIEGCISRERGMAGMKEILELKDQPDALFAASDLSALGAMSILKEKGIKIPQQFGVAGYVNELFSEYVEPSLTSTEQFGEEIGKTAAQVMIDEISNENSTQPKTITIKSELIIRKSSSRK